MEFKKDLFKIVSLVSTYAFLKEKYKSLQDIDKEILTEDAEEIGEFITPIESFIYIPDKMDFIYDAIDEIIEIYSENSRKQESIFLSRISLKTENLTDDEKEDILNSLVIVIMADGLISPKEKGIVIQIMNILNIQQSEYDSIVSKYQGKQTPAVNIPISGNQKHLEKDISEPIPVKPKNNKNKLIAAVSISLILTFCVYLFFENPFNWQGESVEKFGFANKTDAKNIKYSEVVTSNSSDIHFKTVDFEKYVVAVNYTEADKSAINKYKGRAIVYRIKGEAIFQYNFKDFEIDNDIMYFKPPTEVVNEVGTEDVYPYRVDIVYKEENIEKIYEKEIPPIDKGVTNDIAKGAGIVTGVGTSVWATKKVFSGGTGLNPISTLAKGAAVVGSGAMVGGFAYSMTSKYLSKLKFAKELGIRQKEKVISNSKNMIALEFMEDKSLQKMLEQDMLNNLTLNMQRFGIEINRIQLTKKVKQIKG